MLGRVVNALGVPIDGRGALRDHEQKNSQHCGSNEYNNVKPPPARRVRSCPPLKDGIFKIMNGVTPMMIGTSNLNKGIVSRVKLLLPFVEESIDLNEKRLLIGL
ncbi:hypothetical protein L484_020266 [Morus notabilis]|uniref:Uncharacterized protein n=1 Tax=Morus notabilis TaxID=981085 RepID=W9QRX3_9ROSA|nr:hypothetical protein L484_020266 [Morus notabilis]